MLHFFPFLMLVFHFLRDQTTSSRIRIPKPNQVTRPCQIFNLKQVSLFICCSPQFSFFLCSHYIWLLSWRLSGNLHSSCSHNQQFLLLSKNMISYEMMTI